MQSSNQHTAIAPAGRAHLSVLMSVGIIATMFVVSPVAAQESFSLSQVPNFRDGGMRSPLSIHGGYYCTTYNGYFDSNGDRQDFGGREMLDMFLLGGSYEFTEFKLAEKNTGISGLAKIAIGRQEFKSDDGEFEESTTGLQNLILGVKAHTRISRASSIRVQLRAFIDVANEPNEYGLAVSNGSSAFAAELGARTRTTSGLGIGATFYHVNQFEENFRSTNAINISGSYPVYKAEKFRIRAGVDFTYLGDTDEGGHLLTAGVSAAVKFAESPFSIKLDGGRTEELIPIGNLGVLGENYSNPKSLSVSFRYAFGNAEPSPP